MKKMWGLLVILSVFTSLGATQSYAQEPAEQLCAFNNQGPHGKVYVLKANETEDDGNFFMRLFSTKKKMAQFKQENLENFNEASDKIDGFLDLYLDDENYTYEYERLRENILSYVKFEEPFIISAVGGNAKIDHLEKGLNYFKINDVNVNILGQWVTKIDTDDETLFVELAKEDDTYLIKVEKNRMFKKCDPLEPTKEIATTSDNGTTADSTAHVHGAADVDESSEGSEPYTNNPEPPNEYIFALPTGKDELNPDKTGFLFGGRLFGTNNLKLKEVFQSNDSNAWPLTRNKSRLVPADDVPDRLKRAKFYSLKELQTRWNRHIGIDLWVPIGTPTEAIGDGEVFAIGYLWCPGYVVAVEHKIPGHKLPVYAVYKHMSSRPVNVIESSDGNIRIKKTGEKIEKGERVRNLKIGDKVSAGDLVAFSGGSGAPMSLKSGSKKGCIQGAHLHFEVRIPKSLEDAEKINSDDEKPLDKLSAAALKKISQARLAKLEVNAVAVNPADYIQEVDRVCYEQKVIEIENALRVEKHHSELLPQLSAGLCSLRAERSFLKHYTPEHIPKIYSVRNSEDILEIFPEIKKPEVKKVPPKPTKAKKSSTIIKKPVVKKDAPNKYEKKI
ncbi:MAG: M23 family metallopeptidase [Oligoflexia bacterium]|nr:M23 family metallopeptidase [Oligoflexia bacterium]